VVEGDAFMIREIGATLIEADGKLEVAFVLPADARLAAYKSVDIQEKDVILMVNGKKVVSTSDIREIFDGLKPGDEIKIGLKRVKNMMIVSFERADPESLPKLKTMTREMSDEDTGRDHVPGQVTIMRGDGPPGENLAMLEGSGLIAKEEDGAVVIAMVMPHAKKILGSTEVKEGDRILSIQGKKVSGVAALLELYSSVEPGSEITLVLERADEEFSVTFEKAKTQNKVMMMNK
jgi:PDZ domain-containing secreted protein